MPLKANIHVSLNRLRTQKSSFELAEKKQKDVLRKARTRTLIQVGGLVDLTPLLAICDIKLGDDLQLEHRAKAATLLGILASIANKIPKNISSNDLLKYRNIGVGVLK